MICKASEHAEINRINFESSGHMKIALEKNTLAIAKVSIETSTGDPPGKDGK